jgi:hypothetical protein
MGAAWQVEAKRGQGPLGSLLQRAKGVDAKQLEDNELRLLPGIRVQIVWENSKVVAVH